MLKQRIASVVKKVVRPIRRTYHKTRRSTGIAYHRLRLRMRGGFHNGSQLVQYHSGREGNELIRNLIGSPDPVMITRYGETELKAIWSVLSGASPEIQLNQLRELVWLSGFFPTSPELLSRFADVYKEAAREIDCLAVWNFEHGRLEMEETMIRNFSPRADLVYVRALDSWLYANPWTSSLDGKRVLVVHPFVTSIQRQYARRKELFRNKQVLPEFKSLSTIKAVQSIAGNPTEFDTWFEALDEMCSEIQRIDFDVALIGAGAYGLPLAAHVKKLGKKGVHMGGASQILFGIMGKRFESPYSWWEKPIARFTNEHWVRPLPEETPTDFRSVEEGSYW